MTHLRKIRNTQLRFVFLNFSFVCQNIDNCMFCLQMPPVFLDSMKIFMFESIKVGEESMKLIGKKVVKTSNLSKGEELD